jgi:hypothetical protein
MHFNKIAIAAGIVAILPGVATAAPAFDAFRQICGDTRADYPAVVKAANAGGWAATDVKATTMEGVVVSDQVSRSKAVDGEKLVLLAWTGLKGAVKITACTVRAPNSKTDEIKAAVQTWAGFAPQVSDPKRISFRFADEAGGRRALTQADYDAAAAGPGLEMLTVSNDGTDTIIDLLNIKK